MQIVVQQESMFENRLAHNVSQLALMGANINLDGNKATVHPSKLCGATVKAMDLRGGAGLVVASLGAQGQTTICDTSHIHRGYVNLAQNLCLVGANIQSVN